MSNLDTLKSDFQKEWSNYGIYHAKSLFKNLPGWEEILNILNRATRNPEPQFTDLIKSNNNFEIIYKDLLAIKKLSYPEKNSSDHTIDSDATFFFSLFFNKNTLKSVISESIDNQIKEMDKILDISSDYSSLKISLSEKFVPYEVHDWNTCIIHLAGKNDWWLKNDSVGLEKLYILEPGDMLLFQKDVWHQLSNELPRSSIVGRFQLGESHEF